MKLFKRKFLIFSLVCCLGVQPVALPKEELSIGQQYFLKIAKDPLLSDLTTLSLWTYQFIGKVLITMYLIQILKAFNKSEVQVDQTNEIEKVVQKDITNFELIQ